MKSWFGYLKEGLSRKLPRERIAAREGYSDLRTGLKNLRPFVVRHWKKGLIAGVIIVITTAFAFPQPMITRFLIDDVIVAKQVDLLAVAILLLAGIFLAESLLKLVEQFYSIRFEQEVLLDIQHGLFDRTLRLPKAFFDKNETGYLMSRVYSDVQGLRWFFSGTVVRVITNILRLLGGAAFLLYLEWRLALGVIILLPIVVLCVRYFSGKVRVLSHHRMEQQANVTHRIQESLSSAQLIKAFTAEDRTSDNMRSDLRQIFQISLEQSTVNSVANAIVNMMPHVARAIVLALGAYWVIQEQWSLGSLFAFQAYLGYVFSPAQYLATANLQMQEALASLQRVSALYDIVPEESSDTGVVVKRLTGDIEFRKVSFSYDGREPVLQDVALHISPEEHVAIVGPSGVGKTTLVSLILRFYRPTYGEIYLDGRAASEYELGSLRRRIGYVSQSTLLMRGTVIENICYGNPDASMEQVIEAAKVAGIHDFIYNLPQGYETEIGEKGVNLSEGQKQRLAIARAIIIDPDILVLDEPTSALDSITERSFLDYIPGYLKHKTMFIITHQAATINRCQSVLLLNEKQLVAIGTHDSLLETNDYYRSLFA